MSIRSDLRALLLVNGAAVSALNNECDRLELYVKACSGRMALACRKAADLVMADTPESRALAATLDARRLAAELLSRACRLGDTKACASTSGSP